VELVKTWVQGLDGMIQKKMRKKRRRRRRRRKKL